MKVIPPITITDPLLTSSNAAEPGAGETAWVSGTTYSVDDVRIRSTTHRKYQRLAAGAGTAFPEVDTLNWLDIGPTNKWAMFDTLRNSATTLTSPLTVSVSPATRVNAIALMGVVADSATITMTVSGLTKYSYTTSLTNRRTLNWTDYFFGVFGNRPSLVLFDLPPYVGAVVTVTLTASAGTVQCGALVLGKAVYMGGVEYSPTSDALNFSTVERDKFGNASLVQRRTVPKTNQTLWCTKASVNSLRDLRTALNATPAVWSGLDDKNSDGYFEAMLILGIYKEFSISLDHPQNAKVTLQLEEI